MRLLNQVISYNGLLRIYMGLVEVCVNGSYYSFCDVGWDNNDAQVVCNQIHGSAHSKFVALLVAIILSILMLL